MGPVIIFDKSTLESLNPDEAVWLDQFYLSNITPLFFVETLADLEKDMRSGRSPEEVVGSLAYKTPDYSSKPNAHHRDLMSGELFGGAKLDLTYGRPHITGGKSVALGSGTGVLFEPSPEEEAFQRWQDHRFLELERYQAKQWRAALLGVNMELQYKVFQAFFPLGKPKSLHDVKRFLNFYIESPDQENLLTFGLGMEGVTEAGRKEVLSRWSAEGKPRIQEFAPYFTYIFSIDFFFGLAIAADLIGRGRPSHKVDLAYLYYLPFCMVFTSNDKLHAELAPFFLRADQTFVPGRELKTDLAKLDQHYSTSITPEQKEEGVVSFASRPPKSDEFITTRLWDKHMGTKWREYEYKMRPQPDSELLKKFRDEIRKMEKAPEIKPLSGSTLDEAAAMVMRRMVKGHKGKWRRFPPEVMNRRKNSEGEWEDIPPEELIH
ncbi:MAG: hypothetical protein JWN18_402 [Parcubacteria group bacterium]|nr:hypothetical protein [Parcubacteria group bacterium]